MAIKTLKNVSVPKEEDCLFTSPDFKNWASLLEANKDSLAGIKDRKASQDELLDIATEYTHRIGMSGSRYEDTSSVIVTGHQPNWHHCGILAKNIIADKFADQTTGITVHLVLDHDVCDTSVTVPEWDDNRSLRYKIISLEPEQQGLPLEFRPAPSKEQLVGFIDAVSGIQNSFCSDVWRWNSKEILPCKNSADVITCLQAQLYEALGLGVNYLPVSQMSQSDCFTNFICSILGNAAVFTACYNQAILNQRQLHRLKSNQTLKLLKTDDHRYRFQLPFWLVSQAGARASLFVHVEKKTLQIGTEDNMLGTIDASNDKKHQFLELLRKTQYVIRPKAVTLTLFVRLHLADWFVHGTGASNYEYITDDLIRNYHGLSKLNFGIATATMMLPANPGSQNLPTAELCLQPKNEISTKAITNREFFWGLFLRQRLDTLINISETDNENSPDCCPSSR